jgi:hypothetical protein
MFEYLLQVQLYPVATNIYVSIQPNQFLHAIDFDLVQMLDHIQPTFVYDLSVLHDVLSTAKQQNIITMTSCQQLNNRIPLIDQSTSDIQPVIVV